MKNLIAKRWAAVCAAMLLLGLFGPLVFGGPAAQSVAQDEGVAQTSAGDQIGSLPLHSYGASWSTPSRTGGRMQHNLTVTGTRQTITTSWHGTLGDDAVTSERQDGEPAVDWIKKHYEAVRLAQAENPPQLYIPLQIEYQRSTIQIGGQVFTQEEAETDLNFNFRAKALSGN